MFTTGSKLLIGASVVAAICAVAYGTTQDGVMGTVGLVSAAVALAFVAAINAMLRDSNLRADAEASVIESSAAARPAPGASPWPMATALGMALVVLGLVTFQAVFVVGLLLVLAGGGEWMLQAWSEQASSDAAYNARVRERLGGALEYPLAGAVFVGILVYSFSRVMLWLSKTNTVIAFSVLAAVILGVAFFFAYSKGVKKTAIAGVGAVAVIGIVAGGVAAGIDGQRDIYEHETIEGAVAEGEEICESPEEFEVDENASQTIANTADVAATITLTEDDELTFSVPGQTDDSNVSVIQLPRSNPSNIIFRNESSHERRLSVDLGVMDVETEDGATGVVPDQSCTALVEEGGEQLLTLTVYVPSAAQPDGYHFFVPGVDGAEIELVVL